MAPFSVLASDNGVNLNVTVKERTPTDTINDFIFDGTNIIGRPIVNTEKQIAGVATAEPESFKRKSFFDTIKSSAASLFTKVKGLLCGIL